MNAAPQTPAHPRVRWYRRLSLRLATLLALTLLAFDFVAPYIFDAVFDLFGIPSTGVTVAVPDGEGLEDFDGFNEPLHQDADQTAKMLLKDAIPDDDGLRHPTPEAIAAVGEMLTPLDEGFLWLDHDLVVVATSHETLWPVGAPWDFDAEGVPAAAFDLDYHQHPIFGESGLEGWLVPIFPVSSNPPMLFTFGAGIEETLPWLEEGAEDPEHAIPAELLAAEQRMELLARAISWSMTFLVAVLLSLAISRFVTKRITRLAAQVGTSVPNPDGDPIPFAVGGADEIAMLARALDDSRARVIDLVGTLAERDERRREWIAQVSHDLRTPLTALIACLDRARPVVERLPEDDARGEITDILAVAVQDAERVRVLAADLLEIARLDAHADLTLEPVLPGELVEHALRGLAPLGETRGIEMSALLPPDLPLTLADGSRLLRVLENLVRNAVHVAERRVEVAASRSEDDLCIEVRDDGDGFPGEIGPVDLDALSLVHAPGDSSSMGLGLTVASRIIDAHGGKIGAENRASGGATVWFTIPVLADPDPDAEE